MPENDDSWKKYDHFGWIELRAIQAIRKVKQKYDIWYDVYIDGNIIKIESQSLIDKIVKDIEKMKKFDETKKQYAKFSHIES